MTSNRFKAAMLGSPAAPPIGSWLMSGSAAVAEAMGHCGFDFLVVDMEHSPLHIESAISLLRALAAADTEAVVRLAWNDQVLVKQALDAGASTLMFPFIESAEQARAAVAYTRYPPQGVRGVAAMHRGSRYGRVPDYLRTADQRIAVVIQLETPAAIERLGEIAAVPGVDSLFVGPGDLSAQLGHIGELGHDEVQRLIARAASLARAAGKPIGIVGPNPQMVRQFLDYGYTWAAVASDLAFLTGRAAEWLGALKGRVANESRPAAY